MCPTPHLIGVHPPTRLLFFGYNVLHFKEVFEFGNVIIANAIALPPKWVKHTLTPLSVVSTPGISDTEDPANNLASTQTVKLLEVIAVM